MLNHKLLGSVSSLPSDENFENVTLLLSGDGTNGSQNNTFLDSSTNNFTITRNGNTTQGSFSPYGTLWSNFFDGNGDYLRSTATTISDFGTNNFTFEAWIYPTAVGTTEKGIYDGRATDGSGTSLIVKISTGSKIVVGNPSDLYTSSTTIVANTWYHIAIVRSGTGTNQCALFINGSRDGTFTSSTSFTNPNSLIGAFVFSPIGAGPYSGYISNLRIVKSTAVYDPTQATCTVPTTPLTAITNTSLLTCQSNRFIDNSSNAFALTITGDVSVQRFSPFNPTAPYSTSVIGGSGYFDGTGDYLNTGTTSQPVFSGNFTIGGWVYVTSFANTQILATNIDNNAASEFSIFVATDGSVKFYVNTLNTLRISSSAGAIKANEWNYIAMVRSSNVVTGYVNGISAGTYSFSGAVGASTKRTYIGNESPLYGNHLSGYISDFVMTATPTTTVPSAPTSPTGTSLLLGFTNAGIPDLAMQNNLETVGNAQVSTSVKKYGTGSLAFDGTGDYLISTANTSLYTFGAGAFTIEFWVYFNSISGNPQMIAFNPTSTNGAYPLIYIGSTNKFAYYVNNTEVITGSTTPSTSVWYHVAICRSGTSTKLFVNGTQEGSTYSDSNSYLCGTNRPVIGSGGFNLLNPLNGYIDDLRITRGLARYVANFTPAASALPTY